MCRGKQTTHKIRCWHHSRTGNKQADTQAVMTEKNRFSPIITYGSRMFEQTVHLGGCCRNNQDIHLEHNKILHLKGIENPEIIAR